MSKEMGHPNHHLQSYVELRVPRCPQLQFGSAFSNVSNSLPFTHLLSSLPVLLKPPPQLLSHTCRCPRQLKRLLRLSPRKLPSKQGYKRSWKSVLLEFPFKSGRLQDTEFPAGRNLLADLGQTYGVSPPTARHPRPTTHQAPYGMASVRKSFLP